MYKLITIFLSTIFLYPLLTPAHAQEERTIESLVESGHYDRISKQLHSIRDTLPSDSSHHSTLDELVEEAHELTMQYELIGWLIPRYGHRGPIVYSEKTIQETRSEDVLRSQYNFIKDCADELREEVARLTKHIAMMQTGEGEELTSYVRRLIVDDFHVDFLPHAYDEQIKQLYEQTRQIDFSDLERNVEPAPLSAYHEVWDEQDRIHLLVTQRVVALEQEFILDLEFKKHELMSYENDLRKLRMRLAPYFERMDKLELVLHRYVDRRTDYVKRLKELLRLLGKDIPTVQHDIVVQ